MNTIARLIMIHMDELKKELIKFQNNTKFINFINK